MNAFGEPNHTREEHSATCLDDRFGQVTRSYIIASTLRTGSYLLCEGLYETHVAGSPVEAFCPDNRAGFCRRWELPSDADFATYFRGVIENGTTWNGVFGVKIHRHHLEHLARECSLAGDPDRVLPCLFPRANYIYLRRRNLRAQAISCFRAETTNEWWRIRDVVNPRAREAPPVFDAARILQLEKILRLQDNAWKRFFAAEKIEPLQMDYETLWHDYRNEIARALAFIGQDAALAATLPDPRLVRQADSTTEEWCRMLDELSPVEMDTPYPGKIPAFQEA